MRIGIALAMGFSIRMLGKRRSLPPDIEDALAVIREAKKAGLSKAQVKMQRLALCSKVVDQIGQKPPQAHGPLSA